MSATTNATRNLVLAGEPRVQLLPPSVQAREKVRSAQRLVVLALVAGVAVAAAMYGFGVVTAGSAQAALASAQSETQTVISAQAKYHQATQIASTVSAIKQTQQVGTSLEVLWAPLIGRIGSGLPQGVSLSSVTATGQTPWGAALAPEGPLRAPRIAVLALVISSPAPPDIEAVTAMLRSLPGYADSTVQSSTAGDGGVETTISLTLGAGALSGRFATPAPASSDAPADGASR
ncbi:hypothetical protein GCM10009840_12120 [Pseudolysinimonas kribbensis]|uniref:hypothetical protein n=1 Tax=Pseudolysinimonas kribbensis TaxID=433641 RepID=UPI0031DF46BB